MNNQSPRVLILDQDIRSVRELTLQLAKQGFQIATNREMSDDDFLRAARLDKKSSGLVTYFIPLDVKEYKDGQPVFIEGEYFLACCFDSICGPVSANKFGTFLDTLKSGQRIAVKPLLSAAA